MVLPGYLFASCRLEKRDREAKTFQCKAEEFEDIPLSRPWLAPVPAIGGIVALVFGADMLVEGAVNIARDFGVPDAVVGSNIFNVLAILGVTVVIQPIEVSARFREIDTPVILGAALLLLGLLFASKRNGRIWVRFCWPPARHTWCSCFRTGRSADPSKMDDVHMNSSETL